MHVLPNQEKMKSKRVNLIPKEILLKLFLNQSQFLKSQDGLEIANHVTQILLTSKALAL